MSLTAWTWWWLAPILAAELTLILFMRWQRTLNSSSPASEAARARWVGRAAAITTALAAVMLVLPLLVRWVYHATGALGTITHAANGLGPLLLAGLSVLVTAVVWLISRPLARIAGQPGTRGKPPPLITLVLQWAQGPMQAWLGILPPWIAAAAAAVIVAVVLLVTFAAQLLLFLIFVVGAYLTLLWVAEGAKTGFTPDHLFVVLDALAVMLFARLADVNQIPLQELYRSRLTGTYAITRTAAAEADPRCRERLLTEAARTRLSTLPCDPHSQELVICAAAFTNVNREVPPTRSASCLTFDPKNVTLRGRNGFKANEVTAGTADYEHLMGHTRQTLFGIVAMTGDFSPLTGALTGRAARILFTLTNLRSGVWLPHPQVVRNARDYLDNQDKDRRRDWRAGLLPLWYVLPHFRRTYRGDREARLWAHVLELRERRRGADGGAQRALAALQVVIVWHLMKPVLGLLWAEAVGRSSYRGTWIHVTDGGHYDDLGLVEALQRGAKNIVVIDASDDRPDTWYVLGDAMALAGVDAGVDIHLDPTVMVARNGGDGGAVPKLSSGEVSRPWAYGTFERPDDRPEDQTLPRCGNIWVCKLGWWQSVPWAIRAYAAGHPRYPCEARPQQMDSTKEFEAYRQLGECAMADMIQNGELSQTGHSKTLAQRRLWGRGRRSLRGGGNHQAAGRHGDPGLRC